MITEETAKVLKDYFSAQNDVLAVYLYGSYARGTNNALSDVDIAVVIDNIDGGSLLRRTEIAGRISELFKSDNIDVQFLTSATPPPLALSMVKGRLIYGRSDYKRAGTEAEALSKYQDFAPFLALQIKEMEKRLEGGAYANRHP